MGRKRVYHTTRIENIEWKIALWELMGHDGMAYGLRLFFEGVFAESEVEKHKANLAKNDDDLAANYEPKTLERPASSTRKTGTFREVKTIKNRNGRGGKTYQWAYDVTYEDGRRVGSKSIGRVK